MFAQSIKEHTRGSLASSGNTELARAGMDKVRIAVGHLTIEAVILIPVNVAGSIAEAKACIGNRKVLAGAIDKHIIVTIATKGPDG